MSVYFKNEIPYLEDQNLLELSKIIQTPFYLYSQKTITDKSTESIRKLNSKIMNDSRVEFCLLPIADGISFIRKK